MTADRLRLYAACVRAELLARGTPCDSLAADDAAIRDQLAAWIPLLTLNRRVVVTRAETLVIPLVEED